MTKVDEIGRRIHAANLVIVNPLRSLKERTQAQTELKRLRMLLKNILRRTK